jgi:hypothetical protein
MIGDTPPKDIKERTERLGREAEAIVAAELARREQRGGEEYPEDCPCTPKPESKP